MEKNKPEILVVEDEKLSRIALSNILEKEFTVILAKNGKQAIDIAKENSSIDLIILDVIMEGIDGFETCEIFKNNAKTKDFPIIFISSLSDTEDKVKGFQVGGVDFITKPFQPTEILARVKTHLSITKLQKELESKNKDLLEEIEERKQIEKELGKSVEDLRKALMEVKTLQGFIPICANCKSVRNDKGYWEKIESYISDRANVDFSHSLCPTCAKKLYPELDIDTTDK